MKIMKITQMEMIKGGKLDQATACGIGVGLAIIVPSPWTIGFAALACLTGDTR